MRNRNNIVLTLIMTLLFVRLDAAHNRVHATEDDTRSTTRQSESPSEITIDDYVLSTTTERLKAIIRKISEINRSMKILLNKSIDDIDEARDQINKFKFILEKYDETIDYRSLEIYLAPLIIEKDEHPERVEQLRRMLDEYAPYAKIEHWLLNFYDPLSQEKIQSDLPYIQKIPHSDISILILSKVYESFKQNIDLILYFYSNTLNDKIYNQMTNNGHDCSVLKEDFLKKITHLIKMYRVVFDNLFPGVDFLTSDMDAQSEGEPPSHQQWHAPSKNDNVYVRSLDRTIMRRTPLYRQCGVRNGVSCVPCN